MTRPRLFAIVLFLKLLKMRFGVFMVVFWIATPWNVGDKYGLFEYYCPILQDTCSVYILSPRKNVDCVWNVMAHAQKPDFVFRRNGRVHLNRRGRQFSRLLAAEVCASAVVMLDTPCVRGSVKGTGYPLHSPVSPSLPLPCVTVCHHISTGLYQLSRHPIPQRGVI